MKKQVRVIQDTPPRGIAPAIGLPYLDCYVVKNFRGGEQVFDSKAEYVPATPIDNRKVAT